MVVPLCLKVPELLLFKLGLSLLFITPIALAEVAGALAGLNAGGGGAGPFEVLLAQVRPPSFCVPSY